jgi:hypothetical protein
MADILASFLHTGKSLISGALTGFSAVSVHSFEIGNVAGFIPSSADTGLRGTKVFTGLSGLVASKQIEEDTVRHSLVIPESAGNFNMGNILVYGTNLDGVKIPFILVAFPFLIEKKRSEPNIENSLEPPTPGTRFIVNVEVKHSIFGETLSINVVSPEFSSLAFYDTEANVPATELNPYNQFMVNLDSRTGSPVMVSKKADGSYWGMPMTQNFRSPKFGIIDGGNSGDGYKPDPTPIISGGFYTSDPSEYAGTIGGASYEHEFSNTDFVIGGINYPGDE